MQLEDYFDVKDEHIYFTREQASRFAKRVAGDFNPIHDPEAKRFVVPGDLLFAVSLSRFGISQTMRFNFGGMVSDGVGLDFRDSSNGHLDITDSKGKRYLSVTRSGASTPDPNQVIGFTKAYVEFSGHTFTDVLVPLMKSMQVMINPDRPLIIYESMAFELDNIVFPSATLELKDARLSVEGKRGNVALIFNILSEGALVGTGEKRMVLSGLRDYDEAVMVSLVEAYEARKASWTD